MINRLIIVISGELFVRNYLTTGAFDALEKNYECIYLISDSIKNIEALKKKDHVVKYRNDRFQNVQHHKIFEIMMWRYRKKSKTFEFRIKRTQKLSFKFDFNINFVSKIIESILRVIRWISRKLTNVMLGNVFTFPYYMSYLKRTIKVNPDIKSTILKYKPSLVIFPSSAFDPEGDDVTIICNEYKLPTLFLIDNWDNLSSKTLFWVKPTNLAVWGKQSSEHASIIQGFEKSKVTCLGTPRYDEYFRLRSSTIKSPFSHRYILFVGTTLAFDEASALIKLNDILEKNQKNFEGVKIVYRPHPWRQGTDSICQIDLPHIVIDPQLRSAYCMKKNSQDIQPSISYYSGLLQNAEFILGGLTSMLIESLIFHKRYLALVYDEDKNFTSQHNVYKNYIHFEGIDKLDAISFCKDIKDFEKNLLSVWRQRHDIDHTKFDDQRRYYYYDDNKSYSDRLKNLCEKILYT